MGRTEMKILIGLHRNVNALDKKTSKIAAEYNLTFSKFMVLEALYSKGDMLSLIHILKRREDALRRTRKMSQAIYITTSFLAKQVPLALSNTAGSRMCQGIFFVLKKKKEN